MVSLPPLPPPTAPQGTNYFGQQGMAEVALVPPDENNVATLLIRHLPEAIPHDTLTRLFSHYGVSAVRPCTIGIMRNSAFLDFRSEALAGHAQSQLNGLRFLGKVLSVERASKMIRDHKHQQNETQSGADSGCLTKGTPSNIGLNGGSNLGSFPASTPIAERLGVDYSFPPHLEYAYPPPDGNILTNIVNALIAVPRFYTQVLHLMNKMNIPAPFRAALPTPPLPPSAPAPSQPPPPPPPVIAEPPLTDTSSDESELESSEEEADEKLPSACAERTLRSKRKRIKREAIVGPAFNKDVSHEDVGLRSAALLPKEIPVIKKNNPVLHIKINPKQTHSEPKDTYPSEELEESDKLKVDLKPYATPEELESGKLPPEEILSLPKFKNYTAGDPHVVLYIKNLAKDVVSDDFYYVFGSLFGGIDATRAQLNIKLMQEGRMRGQAFITFPSIDLAHRALDLANGYVFKGKPMIIQFGRNPSTAKVN